MASKNKNDINTPNKEKLKVANRKYIDCIETQFLMRFLKGENVLIDDFCQEEYKAMIELDVKVYPNTTLPWKNQKLS